MFKDIIKRDKNGQKEQTSITQRLMSSGIPRVHYVKCYATKACNNASVTHYMSPVSLCDRESMSWQLTVAALSPNQSARQCLQINYLQNSLENIRTHSKSVSIEARIPLAINRFLTGFAVETGAWPAPMLFSYLEASARIHLKLMCRSK